MKAPAGMTGSDSTGDEAFSCGIRTTTVFPAAVAARGSAYPRLKAFIVHSEPDSLSSASPQDDGSWASIHADAAGSFISSSNRWEVTASSARDALVYDAT